MTLIIIVTGVIIFDSVFMRRYSADLICLIERLETAEDRDKTACLEEIKKCFYERDFWAHRIVPTNRLEELETILARLSAYIESGERSEIRAAAAELKTRVRLLYSTGYK